MNNSWITVFCNISGDPNSLVRGRMEWIRTILKDKHRMRLMLVQRAIGRDAEAFGRLYDMHVDRVYKTCLLPGR